MKMKILKWKDVAPSDYLDNTQATRDNVLYRYLCCVVVVPFFQECAAVHSNDLSFLEH